MITKAIQVVTAVFVTTESDEDDAAISSATDLVKAALEQVAHDPERYIHCGSISKMEVLTDNEQTKVLYKL